MNLRHCPYPSSSAAHHYHLSSETPAIISDSNASSLASATSLQSNLSLPSVSLSLSPIHSHSQSLTLPPSSPTLFPSIISALALSGPLLYAASSHRIDVYHSSTLHHLHSFNSDSPSSGAVKSISFSSDRVLTAHQDGKIRVWELSSSESHRLIAVLPTVSDRLRRLALPSNYIQVRRHKKQLWLHHKDAVSCLATHHINNSSACLLYSVSWDKTLKVWNLSSSSDFRCLESVPAHDDAVNAVTVSPDGVVYTGSADRHIRVWARRDGGKNHALVATLERHRSAVNALALSSDGKVLFSGASDRSILVWESEDSANNMVVGGALRGHGKPILCLCVCVVYLSDVLLSGSADRTVRIWRRGMDGLFCCLNVLEGHLKAVKSLVALPSQREITVFSGSLDGEIRVSKLNISCI